MLGINLLVKFLYFSLFLLLSLTVQVNAAGTIEIVTPSPARLSESSIRHGGASLQLLLNGDTWLVPMSNVVRNAIIDGFEEISEHTIDSFAPRRGDLLAPFSFEVTSTLLVVTFLSAPNFDVVSTSTVRITIPSFAVQSGDQPMNVGVFEIFAEQAIFSLSQSYVFTEAQIRSGGVTMALQLTDSEVWANFSRVSFSPIHANGSAELHGFSVYETTIIPSTPSVLGPHTLTLVLQAAPFFDIAHQVIVQVILLDGSVASALTPAERPFFRIVPSAGLFFFIKPTVVAENVITELGGGRLVCSLAYGETWLPAVNATHVLLQMVSLQSEMWGFNNRRREVIMRANVTSPHTLMIELGVDIFYDITLMEEVVFTPVSGMVASGILPQLRVGTAFSDRWAITPTPGRLVSTHIRVGEHTLVQGSTVNVELFFGERWEEGTGSLWISGMTSSHPSVPFVTNWNARRAELLNSSSIAIAEGSSNRTMSITWIPQSGYDTAFEEAITIAMRTELVASRLMLATSTFTIYVVPSPDRIFASHSFATRDVVGRFLLHERHIRTGAGIFSFTWEQGWETWAGGHLSVSNVTRLAGDVSWSFSFAQRVVAGAILSQYPSSITYRHVMRTMDLALDADPYYDTAVREIIRLSIPHRAISSGLPSSDGREFYDFVIDPVGGNITLDCCDIIEEADLHEGRVVLEFRLEAGETWMPGFESQWVHAPVSSVTSEPRGFVPNIPSIFHPSKISLTNSSRTVRVNVGPLTSYDLQDVMYEVITVRFFSPHFPSAALRSGLLVSPQQLSFTIVKSRPVVNLTISEEPLTERSIRLGGWRLRLVLRSFDAWVSTATSQFIAAFEGNQGHSGFTTNRETILQAPFVNIPAAHFDYTVTAIAQSAQSYEISQVETVTLSLSEASFRSGLNAAPLQFHVTPSRGFVSTSVTTLTEDELRTGLSGSTALDNGAHELEVRFHLEDIERWSATAPVGVPADIAGSCSRPSCFDRLKSSILAPASTSVEGQDLVLRFNAAPLYNIDTPENITVFFDAATVESGLVPHAHPSVTHGGPGWVRLLVLPSRPAFRFHNTSWTERQMHGNSVDAAAISVQVVGDIFVSTSSLWHACIEAFFASAQVHSERNEEADAISQRLRSLLNVTRSPSDEKFLRIAPSQFHVPFDITTAVTITADITAVCVSSGMKPLNEQLSIMIKPSIVRYVEVDPPFITEEDIRTGQTVVHFRLPHYERYAADSARVLLTFQNTLEVLQTKSSGGVPIPPSIDEALSVGNMGLLEALHHGLLRQWNVLSPRFEWHSDRVVALRFQRDPGFDIARDEKVVLLRSVVNISSILNYTSAAYGEKSSHFLQSILAHLKEQFFVEIRAAPVSLVLRPSKFRIREHAIRRAAVGPSSNITLVLGPGECWIDSTEARQGIFGAISASSMLGQQEITSKLISPIEAWSLGSPVLIGSGSCMSTMLIPLIVGDHSFQIHEDEAVAFYPPPISVLSHLSPVSDGDAHFTVEAEARDRFIVTPPTISECSIREHDETLLKVILGTRHGVNDSWTPHALMPGAIYAHNATLASRTDHPRHKRGFFGLGLNLRLQLSVVNQELRIIIPGDQRFRIFESETIFISISEESVATRNVPQKNELYFRIVPSVANLRVEVIRGIQSFPVIDGYAEATEHEILRGQVALNFSLDGTDEFIDEQQAIRTMVESFAFADQAVPTGTTLTIGHVRVDPHHLVIQLSADPSLDIENKVVLSFTILQGLFKSNSVPLLVGGNSHAITGGKFFLVLHPSSGFIESASSDPAYLQASTFRKRTVQFSFMLAHGETWRSSITSLRKNLIDAMSNFNNASILLQEESINLRWLFPEAGFSIDESSHGRTLHIFTNGTGIHLLNHVRIPFVFPASVTTSGKALLQHVIYFNITADPPHITARQTVLAAPSIRSGGITLHFTLLGDAWVHDAGRFVHLRVLRSSPLNIDEAQSAGNVGPFNNFEARAARIFNPLHNVTISDNDHAVLHLSFGPDAGYNPSEAEVLQLSFGRSATRRGQLPQNHIFNLTVVVPELNFNISTYQGRRVKAGNNYVFMEEINNGNLWIDVTLKNDMFLPDCEKHLLLSSSDEIVSSDGRHQSIAHHFHEWVHGASLLGPQQLQVVLARLPSFRPCSTTERVWITLPQRCFTSGNTKPMRLSLLVVSPNITIQSSISGALATVHEAKLREGGFSFNLSLPVGEWTFPGDPAAFLINAFHGGVGCPTCFSARKHSLLTPQSVKHGAPRDIQVLFQGDTSFNVPASGETIIFDGIELASRCSAFPFRLSLKIVGEDPHVHRWSREEDLHVIALSVFHFNVSGYELSATFDVAVAVPARHECVNVSASSGSRSNVFGRLHAWGVGEHLSSSNVNVAMQISVAGKYRVCYRPGGFSSKAGVVPFVDLSSTSSPPVFVHVAASVSRRMVIISPSTSDASNMVSLGQPIRVQFFGKGLRSTAHAGDAVKVVLAESQPNCSAPAVAEVHDLDGEDEGNTTSVATLHLRTSGPLAICYRLASDSKFVLVGHLNTTAKVSGLAVDVLEPFRQPHVLLVRGIGLDSRFDNMKLIIPDVGCSDAPNRTVTAAATPSSGTPSINVRTMSPSSIYEFHAPRLVPLYPSHQHSLTVVQMRISAGIPPGNYSVCYAARAIGQLQVQWRGVGLVRVLSGIRHVQITNVAEEDGAYTIRAGSTHKLLLEGIGFLSSPGASLSVLAFTNLPGGCDSVVDASQGASATELRGSDLLMHGMVSFQVMGRVTICFTSVERRFRLSIAETNVTYIVTPSFDALEVKGPLLCGADIHLNITGVGLDAHQLHALVLPPLTGSASCPNASVIEASKDSVSFEMVTSHRSGKNGTVLPVIVRTVPAFTARISREYAVCVLSLGKVLHLGNFNTTANITHLSKTTFESNEIFFIELNGHGFNSHPATSGGDAIAIVAADVVGHHAECAESNLHLSVTNDIEVGDAIGLRLVRTSTLSLPPGNYTVCYSSFPTYVFRPVATFRVMSIPVRVRIPASPQRVGQAFAAFIYGFDLGAFWATSRIYMVRREPQCYFGNSSACVLSRSKLIMANYSVSKVEFNATHMGNGVICWASAERGYGQPVCFTTAKIIIIPSLRSIMPARVPACHPTVFTLVGDGLDPLQLNVTLMKRDGHGLQRCDVLASGDTSAILAVATFANSTVHDRLRAGQQYHRVQSAPIILTSATWHIVCVGVLGTAYIDLGDVPVDAVIESVSPTVIEPSSSADIVLRGCSLSSQPVSDGGDSVVLCPSISMGTFASCSSPSECEIAVNLSSTPLESDGVQSSLLIPGVNLSTGNYTLCYKSQTQAAHVPLINIRVMSAVWSVMPARAGVHFVDSGPLSLLVGGTQMMFPVESRPVIKVIHNSDDCAALDPNLPPPTEAPSWSSSPLPLQTIVPVPASPEQVEPDSAGNETGAPAHRLAFYPIVEELHFISPSLINITVPVPVMGIFSVCWTTQERQFFFELLRGVRVVFEGIVRSFTPSTFQAGLGTSLALEGVGLSGPNLNASLVFADQSCDPAFMSVRFEMDAESNFRRVTTSQPLFINASGPHDLCVGTILSVTKIGRISVFANIQTVSEPISIEQFSPFEFKVNGSGLSLQDKVLITRFGCTYIGESLPIFTFESATTGLSQTLFSVDTSTLGTFQVCYQAFFDPVPRVLGSIIVNPEVKEIHQVTPEVNPSGDKITFTFEGRGLNTSAAGDSFRVIAGSKDCTSPFTITLFSSDDLAPTSTHHERHAFAVWENSTFPTHPFLNATLCYRLYGSRDFENIGFLVLPVANQQPSFSFPQGDIVLFSDTTSTQSHVMVADAITPGFAPVDAGQEVVFSTSVNDTTHFDGGAPPTVARTGLLTAFLKPRAEGVFLLTLTAIDDGGTLHGGNDRFTNTTLVFVVFPINTAPTFDIPDSEAPVWQHSHGLTTFLSFVTNIAAGMHRWERAQNVSFAVNVSGPDSELVQAAAVSPHGDLSVFIDVNRSSKLTRTISIGAFLVAKDDGGTGEAGEGVDTSPPIPFTILIVVVNNAPSLQWAGNPDGEILAVAHQEWTRMGYITNVSSNDIGQSVHVVGSVQWADQHSSVPFTCAVNFNLSTSELRLYCDTPGNFTLRITAVDDGGAHLGGRNVSDPIFIQLHVLAPYVLSVNPAVGGLSQATEFDFTVSGGNPLIDERGTRMQVFLVEGSLAMQGHFLVRDFGPLSFRTRSLPAGTFTYFCHVIDFRGDYLASPSQQVIVAEMPRTVSFASIEATLRTSLSAHDHHAVSFGLVSISLSLPLMNTLDAVSERTLFIRLLRDAVDARIQAEAHHQLNGQVVSQYASTLLRLCSSSDSSTLQALRRRHKPQQTSVAVMPHSALEVANEIIRSLAAHSKISDMFSRNVTSLLIQSAAAIILQVPQLPQPLWRSVADRDRVPYSVEEEARRAQNAAGYGAIAAAHKVLELECLRMQSSLSPSMFHASYPGSVSFLADLVPPFHQQRTVSMHSSEAVGDIQVQFRFPATSGHMACAAAVTLGHNDVLLGSGDPATQPTIPPIGISVSIVSATRPAPHTSASFVLALDPKSLLLKRRAAGENIFLLAFSNSSSRFIPAAIGQSSDGFVFPAAQVQHLRDGSPQTVISIGSQPATGSIVAYAAAVVPALILLMVVHIGFSWKIDRPMRGRRMMSDFFDIAALKPLGRLHHIANNHIFTSCFLVNPSFRVFSRHHRAVCLWAVFVAPLGLVTAVQEVKEVEWEYEGERSVNSARLLQLSIPLSASVIVVARVMWWLFTSSPKESPDPRNLRQMMLRDKKLIAANGFFVLWALACVTYFAVTAASFNSSAAVQEHYTGFLLFIALCFFWETVHAVALTLVVASIKPHIAHRYVHPSIFSMTMKAEESPFGISSQVLGAFTPPQLRVQTLDATATFGTDVKVPSGHEDFFEKLASESHDAAKHKVLRSPLQRQELEHRSLSPVRAGVYSPHAAHGTATSANFEERNDDSLSVDSFFGVIAAHPNDRRLPPLADLDEAITRSLDGHRADPMSASQPMSPKHLDVNESSNGLRDVPSGTPQSATQALSHMGSSLNMLQSQKGIDDEFPMRLRGSLLSPPRISHSDSVLLEQLHRRGASARDDEK